ncbi:HNH endonuclease family protein [Gordonia rubripertincta]|uniref:HNH endonuclease family protein n=1 Tax=Gordonia rubripertincta TaxID=36822 RepID=UPI0035AF0BAF
MNRRKPRSHRPRGRVARPVGLIALVVVAGLTWAGLNVGGGDQDEAAAPTTSASPPLSSPSSARTQLDTLVVKGRSPKTGYQRSEFGQAWTDDVNVPEGHNGCDTRNDILRRDLTAIVVRPGTRDCVVLSGILADPYTGRTIEFLRGEKTSPAVQIDHVVALSDAWQKGAAQWDETKRTDFANDPTNLQATDGPTNQQKGNGDTATWLPPNKTYRCTYVTRQIEVKARYGLWVTAAEKDAMTKVLSTC